MQALSGLDGAFLHLETPSTPMHVASLHLFDLPPGYRGDFHADIQRLMRSRVHLAPVFRRKLAPMPLQFANPLWVEDDAIDLDCHVQRVTLPLPGTQAQLEDCAGRLHSELLDRSRPLWRLAAIGGLHSGQAAYYIQVHHAGLDGQAGVLLAQALFDLTPRPRRIARRRAPPAEHPGLVQLAPAALEHDAAQYIKPVRHLPKLISTLAGMAGYWPLSIVEHGLGLNITVMSYAGAMGFGFTTARSAVPDARALSAALLAALDELVARSRPTSRRRRRAAAAAAA